MTTIPHDTTAGTDAPFDTPAVHDAVLAEIMDTLQPDRAHHDEVGRTADAPDGCESSPREQPAEPIDVHAVDE